MNPLSSPNDQADDAASDVGPETREIAQARAHTLAMIAGHVRPGVTQAAGELPRLQVTGEAEIDRQDTLLEALPETKRWDPVPGSEGQQAAESPSEEEDDEGRSETEQLYDDGAEAAERERMLQARNAGGNP